MLVEICDCADCLDAENPCANDCDTGEECQGCQEASDYRAEAGFAIDCAVGRL
jgi:hypothetical protein